MSSVSKKLFNMVKTTVTNTTAADLAHTARVD